MMNQITKTNIVSLIFAIACMVLYFFFPSDGLKFEFLIKSSIFLLLLPILYTKIILRKSLRDVGFTALQTDKIHIFYILSAVSIGGLLSFAIVTLGWGLEAYLASMSLLVFSNFGVFIFYEIFFAATALFLFTFLAWGFVYSIKWQNEIYTFIAATIVFCLLVFDFYDSFWVAVPLLVPVLFIKKIHNNKNIIYIFITFFMIGLILDTFIVKTFI